MGDDISTYRFVGANMEKNRCAGKGIYPTGANIQSILTKLQETLRHTWETFLPEPIDRQCSDFHNKCELIIKFNGQNFFDR